MNVSTSEKSGLIISIYDDKEAADRALAQHDKHQENAGLAIIFAHEGRVSVFYVEKEQTGHLLKSHS